MKPLIGITSYYIRSKEFPGSRFVADHLLVSYPHYAESIEMAGGVPVNLPLFSEPETTKELMDSMDGLIFCGGEDISPRLRESLNDKAAETPLRDTFEINLFEMAVERRKPILAICRGMQLLNVYFGGTLIQDIAGLGKVYLEHQRTDAPSKGVHRIDVKDCTPWKELLGSSCQVNSLHHQAIENLGRGLRVVALSEDGLIEMVDNPNYPFMLGVQWHPEMLRPWQAELFRTFVSASGHKSMKCR